MAKEEKVTFYKMSEEQWQAFVGERGLYILEKKDFSKKFPGLYLRGSEIGLIQQMYPNEHSNSILHMNREQLIEHGRQKGYDRLTRGQLFDKDPYYYNRITGIGGIEELIPKAEKIVEEKPADPDKKYYGISKETIVELMKRHIEQFISKGRLPRYFWKYLGKNDFEFIRDKENYHNSSRGELFKENPPLYYVLLKSRYLRKIIKIVKRKRGEKEKQEEKKAGLGQLFFL
jgi:hypothetical protein